MRRYRVVAAGREVDIAEDEEVGHHGRLVVIRVLYRYLVDFTASRPKCMGS